jgi:hypothetical protein
LPSKVSPGGRRRKQVIRTKLIGRGARRPVLKKKITVTGPKDSKNSPSFQTAKISKSFLRDRILEKLYINKTHMGDLISPEAC